MKVTQEYREKHPVELIGRLTIHRPNGDLLRLWAIGTARLLPSIEIAVESSHPSGRTKTDTVTIQEEEAERVFKYLRNALANWT